MVRGGVLRLIFTVAPVLAGPVPSLSAQESEWLRDRPAPREGESHEKPAPEARDFPGSEIDEGLLAAEGTVREILAGLTIEVETLHDRIVQLGERVRRLTARASPDLLRGVELSREGGRRLPDELVEVRPGPLPEEREGSDPERSKPEAPPVRMPSPWVEGEEALMYERLLERQRTLLSRWEGLGSRRFQEEPLSEEARERRADERVAIRRELQRVLAGIFDLRERGRRNRLEKLRRELDLIERELAVRRDDDLRRRLVEHRLEELLEERR